MARSGVVLTVIFVRSFVCKSGVNVRLSECVKMCDCELNDGGELKVIVPPPRRRLIKHFLCVK